MLRERPDLWRHGGAEHKSLTLFRQVGDDFHDIVMKANIKHPVGLIEYQHLQVGELNVAQVEVGYEPAGGCHYYVCTVCKCSFLLVPGAAFTSSVDCK